MRFAPTTDLELVRQILTHPRIWPHISDDFSPRREDFTPLADPRVEYVLVYADSEVLLGLFMFVAHSPIMTEVHTCLLPSSWGSQAIVAARGVAAWKWTAEPALQRIITQIPVQNRLAVRLAANAGMEQYGVNPRAHQRYGNLYAVEMWGVNRPEEPTPCPQQ